MRNSKKRKRHFLLLEVMIAAFLLLVCITPLLRISARMALEQQAIIRENTRDHLAHLIHAKLTERLYQRKIPLEEIRQKQPLPVADSTLEEELKHWDFNCSCTWKEVHPYTPQNENQPTMYLGLLHITMKDKLKTNSLDTVETIYDYVIYIDAGELARHGNRRRKPNDEVTIPIPPQPDLKK